MRPEGKKGKKKPLNNASNVMPKSYTILLMELGQKDRVIARQRSVIEALERNLNANKPKTGSGVRQMPQDAALRR